MGPFPTEGPNEGLPIGARTITPFDGGGDWIVAQPDHWIFAGTGMKKGERIPGLVGWEFHGHPANLPGLEIVAEGTALSIVQPAHWTATVYPGAPEFRFQCRGHLVSARPRRQGHMLPWSHWSRPHGPDPRVERITANVLRRALAYSYCFSKTTRYWLPLT